MWFIFGGAFELGAGFFVFPVVPALVAVGFVDVAFFADSHGFFVVSFV